MIETMPQTWQAKRTDQTREVERVFRENGFDRADAYRYNSAAIRLRVIDPRFEGLSIAERDSMVDPIFEQLPEETQGDIMTLLTLAPSELIQTPKTFRQYALNVEFIDPSPSLL